MFNNYSLNNLEIEKIILDFEDEMKKASKIVDGKINEKCIQEIRIALFKKLSRNRNKKNWKNFKKFSEFCIFAHAPWHLYSRRTNSYFLRKWGKCYGNNYNDFSQTLFATLSFI